MTTLVETVVVFGALLGVIKFALNENGAKWKMTIVCLVVLAFMFYIDQHGATGIHL